MIFLSFSSLQAQQQCAWLTNHFIDLVAVPNNSAAPQPGCAPLGCDEVMYEVYLKTSPGVNAISFQYSYFSILGQVVFNTNNGEYIDVARSKACSPSWTAAELSFTPNGFVAFELGDPSQSTPPTSAQTIALSNGSALLFRVIVHAGPGSQVNWTHNIPNSLNPYMYVYGKNTSSSTQICAGLFAVQYGGALSPKMQVSQPSTCSGLSYTFGSTPQSQNILQQQVGNLYWVPIQLSGLGSAPQTIDEIEMVVEVKTNTYMEYGNIAGTLIKCNNIGSLPCDITVTNSESGGFFYRHIYAKSTNINYTGDPELLRIALFGPLNRSLGGTAEVSVKYIRVKRNGVCCSVPTAANSFNPVTLNFLGLPVCPTYVFTTSDGTPASGSCEVVQDLNFTWTTQQNNITFDRLDFKMLFFTQMPVVEFRNNTICPNGSCISSVQVGSGSNAYTEVTISLGPNANVNLTKNNAKVSLVFSATEGCINGFHITKSEVKDYTASSACVPTLPPPYPLIGHYAPRCITRLAGKIDYRFRNCDNFQLVATPVDAAGPNCTYSATVKGEYSTGYGFCVCKNGFPYTISCKPQYNTDPICGVTTWDLVLISRSILGLQVLPDYFAVAADANCSGTVTTFDIVDLRKLILGTFETLPNGVPAFKVFSDNIPVSNWPSSEFCQPIDTRIESMSTINANFQVVKTGDVDGSCYKGACFASDPVDRSAKRISIGFGDHKSRKGEVYDIPMVLETDINIAALQCELKYDPSLFKITGFQSSSLPFFSENKFSNPDEQNGSIRFVWHNEKGTGTFYPAGTVLGYIKVEALESSTSPAFTVVNRNGSIQTVLYDGDGAMYEVENSTRSVLELGLSATMEVRIIPNPSNQSIRLSIDTPEETMSNISIFNQLGERIVFVQSPLTKGNNSISLDKYATNLVNGVYYLEVSANQFTTVKKLVRN